MARVQSPAPSAPQHPAKDRHRRHERRPPEPGQPRRRRGHPDRDHRHPRGHQPELETDETIGRIRCGRERQHEVLHRAGDRGRHRSGQGEVDREPQPEPPSKRQEERQRRGGQPRTRGTLIQPCGRARLQGLVMGSKTRSPPRARDRTRGCPRRHDPTRVGHRGRPARPPTWRRRSRGRP